MEAGDEAGDGAALELARIGVAQRREQLIVTCLRMQAGLGSLGADRIER
jgi:hypothetical protein